MDWSSSELPPPPELGEVAADTGKRRRNTKAELENLFLEIAYLLDADFIVDRLIAQAYH